MSLQEALDTLSGTLAKTDAQVKSGQNGIHTAHDQVSEARKIFQVQAQAVLPASSAVSNRLKLGQGLAEQSMQSLQNELGAMETGLAQRIQASRKKIAEMGEMVRSLTALLVKVEGSLRQQQETTEQALSQAGERSREAFRQSRGALNSLDEFVANSLLPKLRGVQQSNQTAVAALGQKVRETFLPAVDEQMSDLQTSLNRAVEVLQQETLRLSGQVRESQAEAMASTGQQCADHVVRLQSVTGDSAKVLARAVLQVEEKMQSEADSNRSLLQTYQQRVQQDAKDQITVPLNLKLVLDRVNIR